MALVALFHRIPTCPITKEDYEIFHTQYFFVQLSIFLHHFKVHPIHVLHPVTMRIFLHALVYQTSLDEQRIAKRTTRAISHAMLWTGCQVNGCHGVHALTLDVEPSPRWESDTWFDSFWFLFLCYYNNKNYNYKNSIAGFYTKLGNAQKTTWEKSAIEDRWKNCRAWQGVIIG